MIIDILDKIMLTVSDILYRPWFVPVLLLAGGIYFTIRTKFLQGRMFIESLRVVLEKPKNENGISSFGALMVSTASRVGTGNIFGVATAIIMGGFGAIFWMWVVAILGGATAFIESTLAQVFKKRNPDGSSYGGPAFYMRDALNARWLGVIFSILVILTYAVGYNMLASYNLQSTFKVFHFYHENATPAIVGIILAVLFGIIVIGGAKRISHVTEIMVPVMGVTYVAVSLIVLVINHRNIPGMFAQIFEGAFDFRSILGGFTGSCMMWGIKRGLYSNEAGMGSAPNAAATADVSHPAKQGLVQMLSVFIDTLLICTATAFMCMSTNVVPSRFIEEEAPNAAGYVQTAMEHTLGSFGPIFLTLAMTLFAFTTLIGNYSYCEGCLKFIIRREPSPLGILIFRIIATLLVFVGAVARAGFVWDTSDVLQGLMVVCNVPSILILGGIAIKCLKDYSEQKKQGKDPRFLAKNIDLKYKTDFWNE